MIVHTTNYLKNITTQWISIITEICFFRIQVFTDYDGSPISTLEQKDINEFAGMLFDKLESNKECSLLLSRTIKGKILWRTRSIETPYKSDREESFFMVTAEVKVRTALYCNVLYKCVRKVISKY